MVARKHLFPSFPLLLVGLYSIFESFSYVLDFASLCVLLIVYYTYFFIGRWVSQRLQKFQQEAAKTFRYPDKETKVKGSYISLTNAAVLTYNMFLRPPFVKNNENDYKNERLDRFIEEVLHSEESFDVLLLQEIFALGNLRQHKLMRAAREVGFHFHARSIDAPIFSKKLVDAGVLILSKYPIVERDAHVFETVSGHQIDSWVGKQVIYAKILFQPNLPLHVFTTHMQASYVSSSASATERSDSARLAQVDEMIQFIRSKVNDTPALPVLIGGDFNIDANTPAEFSYLLSAFNQGFPSHVLPIKDLHLCHKGAHAPTYASLCPEGRPLETVLTDAVDLGKPLCIDHMFFMDTRANELTGSIVPIDTQVEEFSTSHPTVPITHLSDHFGLSTVLCITPTDS